MLADVIDNGSQSDSVCDDAANGSMSAERRRTSSRTVTRQGLLHLHYLPDHLIETSLRSIYDYYVTVLVGSITGFAHPPSVSLSVCLSVCLVRVFNFKKKRL